MDLLSAFVILGIVSIVSGSVVVTRYLEYRYRERTDSNALAFKHAIAELDERRERRLLGDGK